MGPEGGARGWAPRVGPEGGARGWGPRVGPEGGARGTQIGFIIDMRAAPPLLFRPEADYQLW